MRSSRPNTHVSQGTSLVRVLRSTLLASGFALLPTPAVSQGTAAEYARAEGLRARIDGLVIDAAQAPIRIGARKCNDFFVHNLMGVEPPDRNGHVATTSVGGR